ARTLLPYDATSFSSPKQSSFPGSRDAIESGRLGSRGPPPIRKVRGASQEAVAMNTGRVFLVRQWARIRLLARRNPAPFPSGVARSKSPGLDGVPASGT